MSKLRKYFQILILFVFFSACKNNDNYVPYAYVNFDIFLSDPQYYELNAIGNSVSVNHEGYKGIVIYRKSSDEFMVFDKCCTNDPTNTCEIAEETSDEYTVKCNCCGSIFSLYDGYPMEGPAKLPLKEYNYQFDGDNMLSIFN